MMKFKKFTWCNEREKASNYRIVESLSIMTYEELKQAAKVFHRIEMIRSYVTKERFAMVASTRFGIDDERTVDVMYGLMNLTQRLVYYIANEDNEEARKETRWPEYMKLMPKAIEIAESAYDLKPKEWGGNDVPHVRHEEYKKSDCRRYFYTDAGKDKTLDVSLHSRADIILLSELLQREDVKLEGVAEHLGYLEGEWNGKSKERFDYFEGDIYFLHGDVGDRVFYNYYDCGDESGVYIATKDGWRKLLYTPGRGYIDREGEIEYDDDKHFYSDYKMQHSGMKFRYIGNIHNSMSVLREKKIEKKED